MDHKLYFENLQILGKKEIHEQIIWRNKIRSKLFKKEKKTEEEEGQEEIETQNEENKKTYMEKNLKKWMRN